MLELAAGMIIGRFAQTGSFDARVLQNDFHPFLGWEHPRNAVLDATKPGAAPSQIHTDAKGRSITPLAFVKPRLTLVVTGGSTMFGVGSSDNSTTVPSLLEKQPVVLNPMGYLRQVSSLADLVARVVLRVTSATAPAQDGGEGPPTRADTSNVLARALFSAEHYAAMKAMTELQGGRFHMVLQPTAYTLPDFDLSRLTDRPIAAHQAQKTYENAFYQSLSIYLGRLGGIDLSHGLDDDPGESYVDNYHYTDEGANRLAGRILDALEPEIARLAREKAQ